MSDAFYLPDPDQPGRFLSTELTRGPWSPDAQHAGPPSALLGHVIERCEPRPGFQVGRVAVEGESAALRRDEAVRKSYLGY